MITEPEPATKSTARARHWPPRLVALALLFFIASLTVHWEVALPPAVQTSEAEATRAAVNRRLRALAERLPARYRADTALLQRYLRAVALVQRQEVTAARDSFQRIVEQAPSFAPGWAGYGMALSLSGFDDIPPLIALPLSVAAARRALTLDSSLAEIQYVLIANDMFGRWDLDAAKHRLDAALARFPDDPEIMHLFATWHRWQGELTEAIELKRRTLELDPQSPRFASQVGWNLYLTHRCAEAAEIFQRQAGEYREAQNAHFYLYRSLKCLGRMDAAIPVLRLWLYEQGDNLNGRRFDPPLTLPGRDSALQALFRARIGHYLARRRRGWVAPVALVLQYAELQNADSALIWMDSMVAEHDMSLPAIPIDPIYDFLKGDPRYQTLLQRLPGLSRLP